MKQTTPLILYRGLVPPNKGVLFLLHEDFTVGPYTVPKGFETDLASVPVGFRNIASKIDGIEASVVHDWLYRNRVVPRKEADRVFLELLRGSVPGWKRWVMWGAVRSFGWASY